MKNPYLSPKIAMRSLSFKACFSMVLMGAGMVGCSLSAYAQAGFDMSDAAVVTGASAGRGAGLAGPNSGNTNVTFGDFGYVPDTGNLRSQDVSQAADLLPINHQNTVTTITGEQLPINSYASSQIKPDQWADSVGGSGTASYQTPLSATPGQILPYAGSRGALPPVNTGFASNSDAKCIHTSAVWTVYFWF